MKTVKRLVAKVKGKAPNGTGRKRPGFLARIATRLPALTLRRRVAGLVLLAAASQAAVLTIYILNDRAQTALNETAGRISELHQATNDINRSLASLREVQLTELATEGEDALPDILTEVNAIQGLIQGLQEASLDDGIGILGADSAADELERLTELLEDYAARVSRFGVGREDGLTGRLDESAERLGARVEDVHAAADPFQRGGLNNMRNAVLRMRLQAKEYVISRTSEAVEAFEAAAADYARFLTASGLETGNVQALEGAMAGYSQAFADYVDLAKGQSMAEQGVGWAFNSTAGNLKLVDRYLANRAAKLNAEVAEARDETRRLMTYTVAGTGLLILVLGALMARSITRPLQQQTGAMRDLAKGDLDIAIHGQTSRSELGEMARSLVVFRDNLVETRALRAAEDARKAEAEQQRVEAMRRLAAELESSVSGVVATVSQTSDTLRHTALEMNGTVDNSGERASIAATAATETNTNVGTVATATEELSRSIDEIGERAQRSSDVVREAVRQAKAADDGVTSLAEAGVRISDVVALISDIAEQTNLLALNATIEASRAGEAGRGFTVVANEVKTLAGQTAKATQEISDRIKAMRDATESATGAIRAISGTVAEVDEITHAIAAAVEEQGATTRSISQTVHDAAAGTRSVSEQMGMIDEGTQTTRRSAQDVLGAADALSHQARDLQARLAETLDRLRAA